MESAAHPVRKSWLLVPAFALLAAGCSHGNSSVRGSSSAAAGYHLGMMATACWFGGVWDDAEGTPVDARKTASERHCREVAEAVWGRADKTHVEQLRALEETAVKDVIGKAVGGEVGYKDDLRTLLIAVAASQKENLLARRAADRVKKDIEHEREEGKLTTDEVAAIQPLRAHAALEALLNLQAGPLTGDAHALGILSAMDRMELARGLPMLLKIYGVEDMFNLLFNVPLPSVPEDATADIKRGTWLAYLIEAARSAGHPMTNPSQIRQQQNLQAWGGVLEGFADQLRTAANNLSAAAVPDLRHFTDQVIKRLDSEYQVDQQRQQRQAQAGG